MCKKSPVIKIKRIILHDIWKSYEIQLLACVNEFWRDTAHSFICELSILFSRWCTTLKIFTIWPCIRKVCRPLSSNILSSKAILPYAQKQEKSHFLGEIHRIPQWAKTSPELLKHSLPTSVITQFVLTSVQWILYSKRQSLDLELWETIISSIT